jgi:Cu-Zn family superoxide dismutase
MSVSVGRSGATRAASCNPAARVTAMPGLPDRASRDSVRDGPDRPTSGRYHPVLRSLPTTAATGLALTLLLALPACSGDEPAADDEPTATPPPDGPSEPGPQVSATLVDANGTQLGLVEFTAIDHGTQVRVTARSIPPEPHGFHIHEVGRCEPSSASPTEPGKKGAFLSAGGHLGAGDAAHGEHTGDLPALMATGGGDVVLSTVTDAFTPSELLDADGSAVVLHAGRDNFAHVPPRYAPQGPDRQTRDTGDAGDRLACGVVER